MDDHGIAWMIGGGLRAESLEEQRQRFHRSELARAAPSGGDALFQIRERFVALIGGRTPGSPLTTSGLTADCCAA